MQPKMSREDSRRLRALFEMATDGIITMDERGVIESVNRAAGELFGYAADELTGRRVNILMTRHDRIHHDEYLHRYQATGVPHIIGIGREVEGRRKDGTVFPLRLAVSEVKLPDKTIYTGILHDVSAFREAQRRVEQLNADLENKVEERTAALLEREAELRRALGKEQELNELKSRFLSMAGHEFKTPLSTVLSSIELIELYEGADQQPLRRKHIDRVKDAVSHLTEVLNDFLSLSQLEQGKIAIRPQLVNLRAVISTSIEAAEGQLRPGQEVVLETAAPEGQTRTDPKLLRHILINLISNAAKYSPENAVIRIESGRATDGHRITVRDEGIGIPPADQEHLFDRFFRAGNVENIPGTGLGLNIVRHYTDLLGGRLTFSSEVGRGSAFTLFLTDEPPTT
ncbi:MAG: PAS domain-containing sensor histidine kinase [Saprospiraceae bacterium]